MKGSSCSGQAPSDWSDLALSAVAPLSLARWGLETSPGKIYDGFPRELVIRMRRPNERRRVNRVFSFRDFPLVPTFLKAISAVFGAFVGLP